MPADRRSVRIIISGCLLSRELVEEAVRRLPEGELPVEPASWPFRYDGKDKALADKRLARWTEEGILIPVCPEVMGGLPVPRDPSEISGTRVISRAGRDVTKEYVRGGRGVLRLIRELEAAGNSVIVILKQWSPSCGSRGIYDGTFSGRKIPGMGVAAEMLAAAGVRVFDETELDEAMPSLDVAEKDR